MRRSILMFVLLLICSGLFAQTRDTIAEYEGGHIGVTTLTLYTDSTFSYYECGDVMFMTSRYEGTYSRTDSSITLCTENSFAWLRRPDKKWRCKTWRMQGNKILMYTEEQEKENPSFYKAYSTLYNVNPDTSGYYRFTWSRLNGVTAEFVLRRKADRVWLEVHKPAPPGLRDYQLWIAQLDSGSKEQQDTARMIRHQLDSICAMQGTMCYAIDTTINLSLAEWNHFDSLIKVCQYWDLPSTVPLNGFDGSGWTVTAVFPSKHWSVERWTPTDAFSNCGRYLIYLSGLNEKIY